MKLFTFITVSLIPTIVCLIKCENQEVVCIELCCKEMQYYEDVSKKCKALPDSARIWWERELRDNDTISEYEEFDGCMLYDYLHHDLEHCYSPYYHKQKQKYIIATLDCDFTAQAYIFVYDTYIFAIGISLIFLLITLVIYMKLEELIHLTHWKIFLCYVISWKCSHLLVIVCICLMFTEMVPVLWFCFTSSRLWLNVMAYEVWLNFTCTFKDCHLKSGRRQFLLYSLYVWGVAAISTLSSSIFKHVNLKETWTPCITTAVIFLITLLAFCYIVYKLFDLRQNVQNTEKGKQFIRKSVLILLRVFYLMILSWIIFLLCLVYPRNVIIVGLSYTHLVVEGPIMFALFVPRRTLGFLCSKGSDCRNSYDKKNDLVEEMQTFR